MFLNLPVYNDIPMVDRIPMSNESVELYWHPVLLETEEVIQKAQLFQKKVRIDKARLQERLSSSSLLLKLYFLLMLQSP